MSDPTQTAQDAYTELAPDADFPTLPLDLSGSNYELPDVSGTNPLYGTLSKIELTDLTDGDVDGVGTFDRLMASMKAHLEQEYECNRITGAEYTKAYIELTTAALTTGMSFLFQREQVFLQNQLTQMQARAAEIEAVAAGARLEQQKQDAVRSQFDALNSRAQFAVSKMQLASAAAQVSHIEKQAEVSDKQKLKLEAETSTIDYNRTYILPENKRKISYEIDQVLPASVSKVNYEVSQLMPQQRESLIKDVAIKSYQLSSTLVQQFKLLEEQTQVQRAQTLNTRVDGTVVTGAVGKQKDLYTQQIDSYKKDARYKVGKMYLDAWITQKSLDEGLFAPDQLNNTNVNEVLANLRLDNLLGS